MPKTDKKIRKCALQKKKKKTPEKSAEKYRFLLPVNAHVWHGTTQNARATPHTNTRHTTRKYAPVDWCKYVTARPVYMTHTRRPCTVHYCSVARRRRLRVRTGKMLGGSPAARERVRANRSTTHARKLTNFTGYRWHNHGSKRSGENNFLYLFFLSLRDPIARV